MDGPASMTKLLTSLGLCCLLSSACSNDVTVTPVPPTGTGGTASGGASQLATAGSANPSPGLAGATSGGATSGGAAGTGGAVATAGSASAGSDAGGTAGTTSNPDVSVPTPPCSPAKPHSWSQDPIGETVKLQSNGLQRDYLVHVPKSYDGIKPLPVVFDLHGWTINPKAQLAKTKWTEKGDSEGFIVVAPNGLDGQDQSWNVKGVCCGDAKTAMLDDVRFVRDIVAKLKTDLCVDEKRIYASGHSNGAAMTLLLGCEAADLFAAVAPVCGATLQPTECRPSRPIAVAMTRSLNDQAVVYDGKTDASGYWQSAADDLALWRGLNHCASAPVVASQNGVCQTYTDCDKGTNVMLCSPRGGHDFFHESGDGNPDNYVVTETLWPFFKQFSLP